MFSKTLNLEVPIPQIGETHSNNFSVLVRLTVYGVGG